MRVHLQTESDIAAYEVMQQRPDPTVCDPASNGGGEENKKRGWEKRRGVEYDMEEEEEDELEGDGEGDGEGEGEEDTDMDRVETGNGNERDERLLRRIGVKRED